MANLNFFGIRTDHLALLRFLLMETDIRVFEHSSRNDHSLREFRTVEDIDAAFEIGQDAHGNGFSPGLALWSPAVMPDLKVRRIEFDRSVVPDAIFRLEPAGAGLMQLYLGGIKDQVITQSRFGHFNQAGASKWGADDGIDWTAFRKLSNRIQYHIGRRLAVTKVKSVAVMKGALALAQTGYALKSAYQSPWQYELPSSLRLQ